MGERDKTNREEERRNEHLTHSHDPRLVCRSRARQTKGTGRIKKGQKGGGEGTLSEGGESCTESFLLPPAVFSPN